MKKKWIVVVALAVAVVFVSAPLVQAWPFGGKDDDRPRRQNREEMRERIGLMMMWKLTETLDLDQETAAKLFPMMNDMNKQQQELRNQRRETIKELKDELDKSESDPAALKNLIDDFKKNEIEMVTARNNKLEEMSKVLTDEQVAKLIVSVPHFEKHMRGWMSNAREMRKWRRHRMRNTGDDDMPMGPMGPPME